MSCMSSTRNRQWCTCKPVLSLVVHGENVADICSETNTMNHDAGPCMLGPACPWSSAPSAMHPTHPLHRFLSLPFSLSPHQSCLTYLNNTLLGTYHSCVVYSLPFNTDKCIHRHVCFVWCLDLWDTMGIH